VEDFIAKSGGRRLVTSPHPGAVAERMVRT
jgi:hypothetical protein